MWRPLPPSPSSLHCGKLTYEVFRWHRVMLCCDSQSVLRFSWRFSWWTLLEFAKWTLNQTRRLKQLLLCGNNLILFCFVLFLTCCVVWSRGCMILMLTLYRLVETPTKVSNPPTIIHLIRTVLLYNTAYFSIMRGFWFCLCIVFPFKSVGLGNV